MFEISVAGKVALFIAVPTTVLLFYWLLARNEEEDHDLVNDEVSTSRQTVIEVKVPRSTVGAIIGRQGANIKKLQEESGARINFKEESSLSRRSDDNRTIIVRGTSESAQKAELMIRKIIADMPAILTEEIQVPAIALGRIIGRGGENIRELSRISKAKIYIERTTEDYNKSGTRKVTITASREQIDLAKSLIQEKVEEEESFRAKKSVMEANREQRMSHCKDHTPEHDTPHMSGIATSAVKDESWDCSRVVIPEQKDYMEVYISAVEHPGHFWIQILSSEAMQLDQMTDEMNRFYATDEAKLSCAVNDVSVGDMVAAPFEHDNAWYRAKVIGIHDDKVDLYFVDFGDSEYVWTSQIRKLRPDFLSLKFQAVECKLANVKPAGDNWSEAAIDFFEEITYCAQWKVLIAKTVRYESTDTCMMPCLQLYDTNGEEDVDINELMLSKKHGVMDDDWMAGEGASASSSDEKHKDMDSDSDLFFRSPEPEEIDEKANLPSTEKAWVNDYPWAWAYNDESPWQETVIKETEYQEKWLAQRDSFNYVDSPEGERIHVGADASNPPDYGTMAISTELTSMTSNINDNVLTVIEESGWNNTDFSTNSLHIDNNKNIEILDNHAHNNSDQFVKEIQAEDVYAKRDILKHDSCDSENLATTSDDTGFSMSFSEAEAYDHPSFSEMTTSQSSDMNISHSDTMSATDLMSDGASENLEETGFPEFPSMCFADLNSQCKEFNMSEISDKDSGLDQSLHLSEEKQRQESKSKEKTENYPDQSQCTAMKGFTDSNINESIGKNNNSLPEGTSISGDNTLIVLDDDSINQRDHDTFLNDEYERNFKQFQQNIIYENICESSIESFDGGGGGGNLDGKTRIKESDSNISDSPSDVSDESVVLGVGYCVIADQDLKQTTNLYPPGQNDRDKENLELEEKQNDVDEQVLSKDSSVDATDATSLAGTSVDTAEIYSHITGVESSVDIIGKDFAETPSNLTGPLVDAILSPDQSAESLVDHFETSVDAVNPQVHTFESSVDDMELTNVESSITSGESSVDDITQPVNLGKLSIGSAESSSDVSEPYIDFPRQSIESNVDLVNQSVNLNEQSIESVESSVDNTDIFKTPIILCDPFSVSIDSFTDIVTPTLDSAKTSIDLQEQHTKDVESSVDNFLPPLSMTEQSIVESSDDNIIPPVDMEKSIATLPESSVDRVESSVDLIEPPENSANVVHIDTSVDIESSINPNLETKEESIQQVNSENTDKYNNMAVEESPVELHNHQNILTDSAEIKEDMIEATFPDNSQVTFSKGEDVEIQMCDNITDFYANNMEEYREGEEQSEQFSKYLIRNNEEEINVVPLSFHDTESMSDDKSVFVDLNIPLIEYVREVYEKSSVVQCDTVIRFVIVEPVEIVVDEQLLKEINQIQCEEDTANIEIGKNIRYPASTEMFQSFLQTNEEAVYVLNCYETSSLPLGENYEVKPPLRAMKFCQPPTETKQFVSLAKISDSPLPTPLNLPTDIPFNNETLHFNIDEYNSNVLDDVCSQPVYSEKNLLESQRSSWHSEDGTGYETESTDAGESVVTIIPSVKQSNPDQNSIGDLRDFDQDEETIRSSAVLEGDGGLIISSDQNIIDDQFITDNSKPLEELLQDINQLEVLESDQIDEAKIVSGENILLQGVEQNDVIIGKEHIDSTEDKMATIVQDSEAEMKLKSEENENIKCQDSSASIDKLSDESQKETESSVTTELLQEDSSDLLSGEQNSQDGKPSDIGESEVKTTESVEEQETDGPQAAGEEGLLYYNFGEEETKTEMMEDMKIAEIDGTLQFVPKDFVQEISETDDVQKAVTDVEEDGKMLAGEEDHLPEENEVSNVLSSDLVLDNLQSIEKSVTEEGQKLDNIDVSPEGLTDDKESYVNQICEIRESTENSLKEIQIHEEIHPNENESTKVETTLLEDSRISEKPLPSSEDNRITSPEDSSFTEKPLTASEDKETTPQEDSNITEKLLPASEDKTDIKNLDLENFECSNLGEQKSDYGQSAGVIRPSIDESIPLDTSVDSPEVDSDINQLEVLESDQIDEAKIVSGENILLQGVEQNDVVIGQELIDSTEDKMATIVQDSEAEMKLKSEENENIKCQDSSASIDKLSDESQKESESSVTTELLQEDSSDLLSGEQNSQDGKPSDIGESEVKTTESVEEQETDGPQAAGEEGFLYYNFGEEETKTEMMEDMKIAEIDGTLQFVPKDFVQEISETDDVQKAVTDVEEDGKMLAGEEDHLPEENEVSNVLSSDLVLDNLQSIEKSVTEEGQKLDNIDVSPEGLTDDKESYVNQICEIRKSTENSLKEIQIHEEIHPNENESTKVETTLLEDSRISEKPLPSSEDNRITSPEDSSFTEKPRTASEDKETTPQEDSNITEKLLPASEDKTDIKNLDLENFECSNLGEQKSEYGQSAGVIKPSIDESVPLDTSVDSPEVDSDINQLEVLESDQIDEAKIVSGENIMLQGVEQNDVIIGQELIDSTEDKIATIVQDSEAEMKLKSEENENIKCQDSSASIDKLSDESQKESESSVTTELLQEDSSDLLSGEQNSQDGKPSDIGESEVKTTESVEEQETDGPQAAGEEGFLYYNFGEEETKTEMMEDMKIAEIDGTLQFVPKDFVQEISETDDVQKAVTDVEEDGKMLAGEEDHLPEENEVSNVLSSDLVLDNLQSIEKSVTEEGQKLDNIDVSPEGLTDDKESYVNQICEIRESTENSLKEIQIHEEIHPNENESTKVETTLLEDSRISEKPLPSSEDNRITSPEDSSFTEKPRTASEDKETTPQEDSNITEKLLPASEDKTDIKNLDLENFECSNLGEQKSEYGQSAGVIKPSIDESVPLDTSVDSPEVDSDINQLEVLESDQIDEAKIVSGENIMLQGVEQNDVIIGQELIDSTEDKIATIVQDSEAEMKLKSEENENIKCQDSSASIDKLSDESQKESESSVTTELLQEDSSDLLSGEQNSQDGKPSDIGESEVKTTESVEEQETDGPQAAGEEGFLYYNFGEEETKTEMMEDMKIAEIDGTLQFVPKDFVQEISETDDVQKAVTDVEEDGKMLAGEEDHLPEENEVSNVLSSDLVLDNLQSIEKSVTEEGQKLDNIDVSPEGLTDDKESYVNQICEIRESTENSLKEIQIHEEIHPNENESTKVETTLLEDSRISEKPLPSSEDNRITSPEDSSFTEKPLTASEDKETTPQEDSNITEKLLPASEDKTDIKNLDLENFECSNLGEQKSEYGQSAGVIKPSIDESVPLDTSVDSPEVDSDINQLEVLESDQIDEAKIVSGENILLQGVEQNDVVIGQELIDSTEEKMATIVQDSEAEMKLKSEENENIKCQDSSASIDKLSDESQKESESSVTTELLQEDSSDLLSGEQNSQDGKPSDIGESEVKTTESVEEQETDGPQAAGEEGFLYYNFGEEETKTEMMEDMKIAEIDGTLQFVPKDFVQEISETDDVQKAVTDVGEDGKMLAGEEDHLPEENEVSNVLSSDLVLDNLQSIEKSITEEGQKLDNIDVSPEGLTDDKESYVNQHEILHVLPSGDKAQIDSIHHETAVVIASELSLCVDSLKKEMELISSDENHESVLFNQQVTSISNDVEELNQVLQSSNEGNDIHSALAQPEKDADIDWLKSPGILYRDVIQETLVDKEKESECRLDGDTNLPEPQVSEQVFGLAYNDFYGRSQYEQNPFSTFTLEHTQTDQPDDSSKIVSEDVCDSDYSIQPHEEIIDQSRIYVGEWLDGCHEAEPISYSEELVQDTNEVEKDDLNDTSVKEDVDSDDDYVIKLIYIPSEDESEKNNDEILEDIDNIEAVTNESAETKFQTLINQLEEIEKMPVATSRRDKIPKSLSDLAEEVVQNDFFKIGAASLGNVNRTQENKGTAKEDNISREEKLEISKMDPLKQELFDKFEELFILEGDDSIDSETDEITNNLTLHDGSSIDSYQGSVESLYVTAEEMTTSEDDHFSSGRDTEGEGDVEEVDSEDEPITIQVDDPTLKISDSVHNIADETDTEVEDDIYDQNHSDNDVENDIDSCVLQEVEQEINQRQGTHDIGHDISSTEEDRHEQLERLDSKTYTNDLSSLEVTNMDDSLEHLKPLEELLKAHEIDNIDDQAKILLQDDDQLTPSGSQNEQLTPDSSSQQLQSSPQYVCEDQQDKDDSHEQTLQLLSQYILPPDTKVDTDFEDAIVKEENETNIELKEDADITSGLALATIMEEEEDTESKVISKQKEQPGKEVASSLELHIQERTKLETEIVSLMSEILSVVSDKATRDVERAEVQKLAEDIEDITQQMKYRHQMICMIADEIETNDESTLTSNTSTSDAENKVNISTDIEVNFENSETDKENLHSFGKVHTKEVKHFVPFFTMDSNEGDESPNFCDDLEGIEEKDNMAEGVVIEEENNATKISNVIDQTPVEHVSLNSDDENEANIQTIEGNKGNLMFTEAQTIHPEESTSEIINKDNVISHYEGLIEPDQSLLYKLETLYFIESKDYGGDEGISPAVVAPGEEDTDLISAKESRIEYIESKIVEKSEVSLQIEHSDALEQIPPEEEAKHLSIVSFDLPVTLTEQVEEKPSFERQISELSFEIGDSSKSSENYNSSVQTIEEQTQSEPKYTSSSQIIVDNFQVSDLTQSPPPMETSQQNIFMNMAVVEITSTDECSMSVTQSDMDDSVFGIESESESDRNRINIGQVGESDHDSEQPTFDCVPWSSRKDLYGYKSPSRIYKSEFLKEIGSPTSNDDISIQIKDNDLGISEEQTSKEESDTFLSMKDDFMSEARNEKIEDYTQSNLMSDFHRDECSSPHSLTDEQILDLGESGPSPIEHPTTEEKKDETINTIFIEAQKDKLENEKPDSLLVEQILQETENISKEKFVEPEEHIVPSINLNSTDEIVQTSNRSNDAINKIQGPESNLTQDDETSMDDCKDVSKKENDMTFHDVCLDQEKLINIESTLETSKKESSIEFQDLREEQKIKNNIAFGGNAEPIINTHEEKGVNSCTGEYFVQSADIKSEQDNSKQTISDTEAEAEVEFFSNQEPAKPQVRRGETPQEIMTRILQETEEMLNTATLVETSQDNSSMNEEITCVTNAVKMLADYNPQIESKEEDSKVEFMQVSSDTDECPEKDVITNTHSNPEDVISNIETSMCHSLEDNPSINTETLLHSDQPSMMEFSEYTTQSDIENIRHSEDYSSTGQNNEIIENSKATQFIETFPHTISDEEDIDFESAEAWAEYSNDDNPLDYCNESDIFGRTIYDSGATNVSNVPDIVITASTPADESVHLLGAINPVNERMEECDLIPEDSVLSKQFSEFLDDESEEDFMQEENEKVAQIEGEDNSGKYNSDVYLDKLVDKLNLLEEQNIEIPFDEENLPASDKPYGILTPPDSTQSESDSESASLDAEYEMVNDTDDDLKDEVHFDEEWMTAEATESEIPIRNSSVEEGKNSDSPGQVEIPESNQASSSDGATNQRNTEQSNNVSSDKATYSKPRLPSVYQRTMSATLSGVSEKPDWQVDMASIVLEGELVAEDDENVFEENTIPGEEGTSKKTDDESESKSDTSILSLRNPFSSLCNDSTDTASECDSEKILPTDVAVSLDKKRQLQVGASSNTPEESNKKRKTRRGKKNLRAETSISQAQPPQTTLSPDMKMNKKSRSPSLEKKVETFKLGMDLEQELNETLQMLDTKKRKKKKKKSKDQTSDTACSTSETLEVKPTQLSPSEVKPTQLSPSVDSTAKSKKRGKGKGEKKKIDSENQADAKPDSKSYYSLCTPELSSTASPTESETLTGVKTSDPSSSQDPTDSETRSTVRPKTKTTHIPRIEVKHDASSTTVEQQSYQGKKRSNLLDVEQTHRRKSRSKPRVHSKSRSPGRRRSNVIAVPRK